MTDNIQENLLRECGLNDSERRVLLCLIARGGAQAGVVAKLLHMKRPTVYLALENLVGLGIVAKRRVGNKTLHVAAQAESLCETLQERARERYELVRRAAERLPQYLGALAGQQALHQVRGYEIEAYDSAEAMYHAVGRMLSGQELLAIWNPAVATIGKAKQMVKEFVERSSRARARIRDLMVPGPMTDWYADLVRNPHHEMRLLPRHIKVHSDLCIVEDSVFFVHYERGEELAIRLAHTVCVGSLRATFELLWDLLGPAAAVKRP